MPFCTNLSDKEKKKFHEKVDRTSTKTKINDLMKASSDLIFIMEHENTLRNFFDKNKIMGFLDKYHRTWENLAFITAIAINILILGYYKRFYDKSGFNSLTEGLMFFLGIS
jgi:hypothetical protein